jgi:hypothetical protein
LKATIGERVEPWKYITTTRLGMFGQRLGFDFEDTPVDETGMGFGERLVRVGMAVWHKEPVCIGSVGELRIEGGAPTTFEEAGNLERALEAAEALQREAVEDNGGMPRASGLALDDIATDRGLHRELGETDAELRGRLLRLMGYQ